MDLPGLVESPSKKKKKGSVEPSWIYVPVIQRLGVDCSQLEEYGSPKFFLCYLPSVQQAILKQVLGPTQFTETILSELLENIEGFNEEAKTRQALFKDLSDGTLPPSKAMTLDSSLYVISTCLGTCFKEFKNFVEHVELSEQMVAQGTLNGVHCESFSPEISKCIKDLEWYKTYTRHLHVKEASGEAMLSTLAGCIAKYLNHNCSDTATTYKLDPQYVVCQTARQGSNPAADMAIVKVINNDHNKLDRPILVFEYKPQVSDDLNSVQLQHCTEVILQAHYIQQRYPRYPVIHCLTDLRKFHYFLVRSSARKLEIARYGVYSFEFTDEHMSQHLKVIEELFGEIEEMIASSHPML